MFCGVSRCWRYARLTKKLSKTIEIKTTQITWRQTKVIAIYSVVVVTDGKKEWAKNYDNAVEAVNAYNSFIDHGFCVNERIVTLIEPHGKMHTKVFPYPTSLPIH